MNGIRKFLSNNCKNQVSGEEINAILRRIDSTGEGEINYKDFLKFLTPNIEKSIPIFKPKKKEIKDFNEYSQDLCPESIDFSFKKLIPSRMAKVKCNIKRNSGIFHHKNKREFENMKNSTKNLHKVFKLQ